MYNGHKEDDGSPAFDKPFFATSLFAYVLGLGATIGAMHWFKVAQPALLYIRYV
jgi:hypothetical protein